MLQIGLELLKKNSVSSRLYLGPRPISSVVTIVDRGQCIPEIPWATPMMEDLLQSRLGKRGWRVDWCCFYASEGNRFVNHSHSSSDMTSASTTILWRKLFSSVASMRANQVPRWTK